MGRKLLIMLAGLCFFLSWFAPELQVPDRALRPYQAMFSRLQSLMLAPSCAGLTYVEGQLLARIFKFKKQVRVFGVSNF